MYTPVFADSAVHQRSKRPRLRPCELDEFRAYVSGLTTAGKIKSWRKRWYHAPPDLRCHVRTVFHHNKEAYYQAYRPDDEDIEYFIEEGMKCFAKLVRRLTSKARTARLQPLYLAGHAMIQQFISDLASEASRPMHALSDFVIVSIDVEGSQDDKGINEVGFATLDSIYALESTNLGHLTIRNKNFAVQRFQRNRPFMFGQTMRSNSSDIPRTILDELNMTTHEGTPRKVLLLGHGVQNDVQILDSLGLHVEDLVTGILDTHQLAKMCEIQAGSLHDLLTLRGIPHEISSLHCAGNDAHYTLQLLLSLLCEMQMTKPTPEMSLMLIRLQELSKRVQPRVIRDRRIRNDGYDGVDLGEIDFLAHDKTDYEELLPDNSDPFQHRPN